MQSQTNKFSPKYKPLEEDQMEMLFNLILLEQQGKQVPLEDSDELFPVQVLKKRIEGLNLPIKFDNNALFSVMAFSKVVGHVVVFLVDCLSHKVPLETYLKWKEDMKSITEEDKVQINLTDISLHIYPHGFHTEDSFTEYVDVYLKENAVPWAEIY